MPVVAFAGLLVLAMSLQWQGPVRSAVAAV